MESIQWNDSYSVKNPEIDAQHKEWIAIFNKLDETLLSRDHKKLSTITTDSLKAMQNYAAFHFKFEEEYLREMGYPDLVEHRRLHRDFANQIYEYDNDIRQGNVVLNTSIIKVIKDWLVHHIVKEDQKYAVYAKGLNQPPA